MQRPRKFLLLSASLLLAFPVLAEDIDNKVETGIEAIDSDAVVELDAFEGSGTLSDDELNNQRAREDIPIASIVLNDQDQNGDVTDNVAIGNTSGDNLINGEAFTNSSGFLSTVQNTGNNVLIQNSTIINVTVETPGN